jgi:peptidyl-prolyl cis-trans isomerase D
MLQAIRDRAHSWIAIGIIVLFCIPFALYGVNYYFQAAGRADVASVNGRDISEAELQRSYYQRLQTLRAQLGGRDSDLLDEARLRRETLDQMIREQVVLQAAIDAGYRVGDGQVVASIEQSPAFQRDGSFEKDLFQRTLRNQGLSEDMLVARIRTALVAGQISDGVTNTEFATGKEVNDLIRLRDQERDVELLTLARSRYLDDVEVSEAKVERYYEEHQALFRNPERVKIEYIDLDATALGASLEWSEDALRAQYEKQKDRFRTEEERKASHILFELPANADPAAVEAARGRAMEALERIKSGEDFAALAEELSDDPGSAGTGGDLGFFGRGVMDEPVEKAAFALQPGEVSDPVRSSFGFHIIKLTEVRPETVKPFEEVRDVLVAEMRKEEGERMFYEKAEPLANLTYEHPDTLEEAASALELKVELSDWLTRDSGEGIAAEPKVREAAFLPEVLSGEVNSDPIELAPDRMVVVRVREHREATVPALAEVHEQVVERVRKEAAGEKLRIEAQELLERAQAGDDDLKTLAEEAGLQTDVHEGLKRNSASLDRQIVEQAFRLPKPRDLPSYGLTGLGSGDQVLIAVLAVRDGEAAGVADDVRRRLEEQVASMQGRGQLHAFIEDLRQRAEVEIY